MVFYRSIWSFFLVMTLLWHDSKKNDRHYYLLLFCIFILAVLTGGREGVGNDWTSYKYMYLYGEATSGQLLDEIEPLFRLLMIICKSLKLPYGLFLFILSFISLSVIWKALKVNNVRNCWYAFLIYLSLVFCNYQFGIIRHGAMSSFVILGYSYLCKYHTIEGNIKSGKKRWHYLLYSVLCVLIGAGFHTSGLLFVLFIPLLGLKIKPRAAALLFVSAFLIYYSGFLSVFGGTLDFVFHETDYEGYLDVDRWGEYGFSMGVISKVIIFVYLYFLYKDRYDNNKAYRLWINLLLICLIFIISVNQLGVLIQRLGNTMTVSFIFLLPSVSNHFSKSIEKNIIFVLFILYLALFYQLSWNGEMSNMLPFVFRFDNLI